MVFRRKWLFLLFSILLAAGVVAGCSSTGSGGDGEKKGDGGEVKLRMIESLTSPARTKLLREMLDQFEQENPGIKVELISPPLQSADEKITQMLMAKEGLDVVEVRDQTVKQWSNNDFILDLSEYTNSWEHWDSLNEASRIGATSVDNTPYFIPYGIYQKTLFYRKDWFEEAGLKAPETWDDLFDAAKKLTAPAKNRYGYSFRGGAGSPDYVEFMTWSYLGEQLNPDDGYFTKNGDPMFQTDEAKQALELYLKLYKETSPPDSISWSYPEMVQGFTSGMTAMLIQDPEVIVTAEENMEEGTWDTAPLPKGGPSVKAQQPAGTAGWGIGAYSKHQQEAWKLIEFLSSPEQNLYFAKNNSLIPIHTSAGEDPYFKEGYFHSYVEMNAEPEVFLVASRPVQYKGWGSFRAETEKDIQSLLLGKISVDEALQKWSEYWKKQEKPE